METQLNLFGDSFQEIEEVSSKKYTTKVTTPIYEPSSTCPHIFELVDCEKTNRLIRQIEKSGIDDWEKKFLIEAAHRHSIFNYSKIADYYAHASKEMQDLMERSALVIIDFDKSIEYGYTKLQEEIHKQYLKDKLIKQQIEDDKK